MTTRPFFGEGGEGFFDGGEAGGIDGVGAGDE